MQKSFLPNNYEQPKPQGGNYMKFVEGQNKFRVLAPAIVGWEMWTKENKPVRFKSFPESIPENTKKDSTPKFFWAFPVWNYTAGKIQILEVTQSTIQNAINDLVENEEWGDPREYDLTVVRKGKDLNDTEYSVQPSPHRELDPAIKAAFEEKPINLTALFTGGDAFDENYIDPGEVPFND